MAGYSPYASPYGSATAATTTLEKKGWFSGLWGKKKNGASAATLSSYGGLSSPYGSSGSPYGASMGLRGGTAGTSPYGSTLGGGGYGSGSMSNSYVGGSVGSSLGAGSYGSSTMGGSMGYGSSLMGGGGGIGKATADLVDSNPNAIMIVDPSIHFFDYGGTVSFGGQIETVQAPDSPNMVAQVLSQPGQNKVLVIDGGGQVNSAILDGQAASTAMRNGWKGIIVYGAIRNANTMQSLSIGVKALGTNPRKGTGSMGQRGGVVNLSSAQFQPGWWVFADKDGILISQTDIGGVGGYSSGSLGGTSSFGASSLGGASTFGGTSSLGAGSMGGGSSYGSSGAMGGSSSFGGVSFGAGSMGGSSYGAGSMGSNLGASSPYGSTGYGSTGYGSTGYGSTGYGSTGYGSTEYGSTGGLGAYGRPSTGGLGGYTAGGYGNSLYGKSYSAKKKKNKVFKILLASSIAAIVWIVCLR